MSNYSQLHLDTDERVILEVRKHWIVFAGYSVGLFLTSLFPPAIFIFLRLFIPKVFSFITIPGNVSALYLFFYSLWLLFLWILFFIDWTTYYFDVWYITEKRIIAIDQRHLFDREVSNLRFDKIQDISIETRGFVASFLDFGNLRVQTASEDESDFSMSTVRHPDEIRRIIFNLQNKASEETRSL